MKLYSEVIEDCYTLHDIGLALGIEIYNYNYEGLRKRGPWKDKHCHNFVLRPLHGDNGDKYRATGYNGRRLWAVDWTGHRDFMRAVFEKDPNTVIDTALARYEGAEQFERLHTQTGSDMNRGFTKKVTAESSNEPPSGVTVTIIKQSDIAACPHFILVPEHYRPDGSCRCNDQQHTEMLGWGYNWNGERWVSGDDFEAVR